MKTIGEFVKGNKVAKFKYYRAGNLYFETECGFVFPVPADDLGEATIHADEKAIHLMRYIRKHLATLEEQNN